VPSPILPLLVFPLLLLLGIAPVAAGCTDSPAPRVDWRRCLQDGQDLQGVDLTGAVLRDASFARAILRGAKLAGVEAPEARFTSADLAGADLSRANLRGADFTRTTLRGAKLAGADLRRARFFNADLTDADLSGALLTGADLSTAVLDHALWVDGVKRCAAASTGSCQ
jgi:uncharacterized protein YjbI with pentapeptide repeats